MSFEKCPDKAAFIEFSVCSTLISSSVGGDGISCLMSDIQSVDTALEGSEYAFDDLDKDDLEEVGVKRKPTIEMITKPKVRPGEFDAAAVIKKVRAQ